MSVTTNIDIPVTILSSDKLVENIEMTSDPMVTDETAADTS